MLSEHENCGLVRWARPTAGDQTATKVPPKIVPAQPTLQAKGGAASGTAFVELSTLWLLDEPSANRRRWQA